MKGHSSRNTPVPDSVSVDKTLTSNKGRCSAILFMSISYLMLMSVLIRNLGLNCMISTFDKRHAVLD